MTGGKQKPQGYIGFAVLLILYLAAAVVTPIVSRSGSMFVIGQYQIPVTAFTGVVSSLANICMICLVVFFGKPGFIIAMSALVLQVPVWARNVIFNQNLTGIPGIFTGLLALVAIILIRSRDKRIDQYQHEELKRLTEQQKQAERLFEQTAAALVTAIDAKDEYSHGHSMRVAEYSRRIAELMGKNEEECRRVYYAGMLHDVGKIGITDAIINKKANLTPEEYEEIKKHPVLGNQILSSIRDYPYISVGAHYHHERYDGTGYPDGLKGEEIPEIARIISVADAYDTLSSNRIYRQAAPQQLIREQIVEGAGTQFDPEIAMIMRHLIDLDAEYLMKEQETARELNWTHEMRCGEYRSVISDGILIRQEITRIHLTCRNEDPGEETAAAVILFDSLDGRVHDDEETARNMDYYEYCEIRLGGKTVNHGARAIRTTEKENKPAAAGTGSGTAFDLEAVRCRDHVLITIRDGRKTTETIVALPNSSRFAYIALTGENCRISDVNIDKTDEKVTDSYIPRIAEEISFIDGPEGDIPNVQVDSIRSAASKGIPVKNRLQITFHTMSLPTASLIWHCPYIVLFHSADGRVNGEGYREYSLIRLNGEDWENDCQAKGQIIVRREDDFVGWDEWKNRNREGFDCTVSIVREGKKITAITRNFGLSVTGITILPEEAANGHMPVYAALTGDQCALTNIRIRKE